MIHKLIVIKIKLFIGRICQLDILRRHQSAWSAVHFGNYKLRKLIYLFYFNSFRKKRCAVIFNAVFNISVNCHKCAGNNSGINNITTFCKSDLRFGYHGDCRCSHSGRYSEPSIADIVKRIFMLARNGKGYFKHFSEYRVRDRRMIIFYSIHRILSFLKLYTV